MIHSPTPAILARTLGRPRSAWRFAWRARRAWQLGHRAAGENLPRAWIAFPLSMDLWTRADAAYVARELVRYDPLARQSAHALRRAFTHGVQRRLP